MSWFTGFDVDIKQEISVINSSREYKLWTLIELQNEKKLLARACSIQKIKLVPY